jgi:hypothetical protein
MLQLKVRFKTIILNIARADMPSDHISNFLCDLIQDETYYPEDYFWDFEKEKLEFNTFLFFFKLLFLTYVYLFYYYFF